MQWNSRLWGLTPDSPSLAPHPWPGGIGEGMGRAKVRKLTGWDENSLINEGKRKEKIQGTWCEGNCSWSSISRPVAVATPLWPPKPPSALVECDTIWHGMCRLCPLPAFCLLEGQSREKRRPWYCASTARKRQNTLCYQHFQSQNTAPYGLLWRKSSPSQPNPVRCQTYTEAQRSTFAPYIWEGSH